MRKTVLFISSVIVASLLTYGCGYDFSSPVDEAKKSEVEDGLASEDTDEKTAISYFIPSTELNIRSGAGSSYDVVYVAKKDEALEMTGGEEETSSGSVWYEVITPSGNGWCSGKYGTVNHESKELAEEMDSWEKEEAVKNALSNLTMSEDKVERIKWYAPSTFPNYKNDRTYVLPFLVEAEGDYYLMIRYSYYGEFLGWIRLVFAVDDERYEKKWEYFDIGREFDDSFLSCEDVTEIEPDNEDIEMIRKIADSKETIIRFYADSGAYYDHTVSEADKKGFKQVIEAYDKISSLK